MKAPLAIAALAALAACARAAPAEGPAEIRAAEARLVAHLQGDDPLAWVGDYTEDAVFQEGADAPVSGRAALTEVAKQLGGLSQVKLVPLRTLVQGNLAYVQVRGQYAVGQGAAAHPPHAFRGVMIWRRDADGVWRMLHEMLAPE
jgi:ketosteroid isomerase-like protein